MRARRDVFLAAEADGNHDGSRTMRAARRPLTLADLAALADLLAAEPQPTVLYAAIDALVQHAIGHRLFTLMRVHEATDEVERIYSSNTDAYPVGGRKVKRGTPWSRAVLERGEVFVARTPEELREAFADHALIESLGIGSIMNVPLAFAGRRLGTMNISHEAGWFTDEDPRVGRLLAAFVVPSLLVA
jgi:transcriptional regulator with GAF, ATPase, and Fis domain